MIKVLFTTFLLAITFTSNALTYYISCSIKYSYDAAGNRTLRQYVCESIPDGTGGHPRLANSNANTDAVTQIESIVFPNPSNGIFTLRTSADVQDAVINVIDLSGRLLKTCTFSGRQQQMDIRSLANGQYTIQLILQEGSTMHKLINGQ
jgi:hypothetical protein